MVSALSVERLSGPNRVEPMIRPKTLDREREQDRQREGDQSRTKHEGGELRTSGAGPRPLEGDALQLTDAAIERSIQSMDEAKRIAHRVIYQIKRSPERAIETQGSRLDEVRALDLTV